MVGTKLAKNGLQRRRYGTQPCARNHVFSEKQGNLEPHNIKDFTDNTKVAKPIKVEVPEGFYSKRLHWWLG